MTTLTLIRGLPGSGKSTYASRMKTHSTQHFEADMYFVDRNGQYIFDPSRLHAAHTWCLDSATSFLISGINVIVANTFTTMKEMQPYFDVAERFSVNVEIIEMRNQYGSIHGVPDDAMTRMRNRWVTLPEDFNVKVVE
jgi:predicted kinase